MIKILANDGINPDGKTLLEEAGYQVDTTRIAQPELLSAIGAYDVLIVRSATKVTKEVIDAGRNLKIIARGGVGLDNIDVEHAEGKGILVFNTPAASSQSVAELAFAHMFTLARFLHESNRLMPVKGAVEYDKLKKVYSEGIQLRGRTLGIIGFGRIGQEVARIGVGLGMKIAAFDPIVDEARVELQAYNSDNAWLSVKVETTSMEELLKTSDFITLHVPFSGGKPIIGREEFAKMKKGVFLVNTSRGGTVDEEALLEALDSGQVAGAGLDVFDFEPTPRQELLQHPKLSLTPHIGASTFEAQANIGLELADRILAYFGDDK
ncbi:MAG: Hydroxypyruvate reductase [Haliscomenobacter sp.]|jgi:D-3-phosphoglycerate dehydrogenase|nr:Hydroxypyruvate reductase [Haliscomenobacter sp.]